MVDLTDSYEEREGFAAPRVVCAVDGVRLGQSRLLGWIHLDELPEKTTEHDVEPVPARAYFAALGSRATLRQASIDMLRHHSTLHPDLDCEWSVNLANALR